MRHVVADGEDERLVVLRQDDRIVDQPAKFKDSEEGSDEPGKMKLINYLEPFWPNKTIFWGTKCPIRFREFCKRLNIPLLQQVPLFL